MKRLQLAAAAQNDLRRIAEHTEQQWGVAQRRRYMAGIADRFAALASGAVKGRPRRELGADHRSLLAASHVIVYVETTDAIQVRRVLHQRMDVRDREL
jgi:toxin ParE1/3/4